MIDEAPKTLFKTFHYVYKREYSLISDEALQRFKIFKANLRIIKETNAQNLPYKYGVNQFTDLTVEEFKAKHLMDSDVLKNKIEETVKSKPFLFDDDDDDDLSRRNLQATTSIDWTSLLNAPRDQGQCGDCWAFATAGTVEGGWKKANPSSAAIYLSPQQLLDCSGVSPYGNAGCNGGWFAGALQYVQDKGLVPDSAYPYTAVQGTCNVTNSATPIKIKSYQSCMSCTFSNWMSLLQQGPISVALDATQLQMYQSGVVNYTGCGAINHAVMVVGWDASAATPVMKVRNSWSAAWGMGGHFYIQYNTNGSSCHLNDYAFLAVIDPSPVPPPPSPCFIPSTTFQTQNGWSFKNGQNATLTFSANGPLQIQVYNNATKVANYYTSLSGWSNTMSMIAHDSAYKQSVCNFTYALNSTKTYNYNITYTNKAINMAVGNPDIDFNCLTTINSVSATGFSMAGNNNTQVCNVSVVNH